MMEQSENQLSTERKTVLDEDNRTWKNSCSMVGKQEVDH